MCFFGLAVPLHCLTELLLDLFFLLCATLCISIPWLASPAHICSTFAFWILKLLPLLLASGCLLNFLLVISVLFLYVLHVCMRIFASSRRAHLGCTSFIVSSLITIIDG